MAAVQPKWEGKATEEVAGSTADQVWPLIADFCNLHKWLPILAKCSHAGGPPGEPGMIRRCVPASPPTDGEEKKAEAAGWMDEKLVAIDPSGRWLSYEIVANTMGIEAYQGTMKVLETESEDATKKGCRIEWSFVSDPIQGLRFEDFLGNLELGLKAMAKKIEEALGGAVL